MNRRFALLLAVALLAPLSACNKDQAATDATAKPDDASADAEQDEFAGREIVDNWAAQTGDVTVCPMSGKKFEVKDDSDRYAYQGHEFVFCCSGCIEKVEAEPGKYLDGLVEEAGGPIAAPAAAAEPAATDAE